MGIEVESTITLVEQADGWRIRLQFDGGDCFLSEQAFGSRDDAETAFRAWRVTIGAENIPIQ